MLKGIGLFAVSLTLSACIAGTSFQNARLGVTNEPPTVTVKGLLAEPTGSGPFPAVVLLHTCGGVSSHVSEDWPAFLTSKGFAVLTVDTFGSRTGGRCPQAAKFGGIPMWQDAYGALDYLASLPKIDPNRVGVMGFSLGARALEAFSIEKLKSPRGRNFKAGIAFYGSCGLAEERRFPVMAIIGDRDWLSGNCPKNPPPGISVEIIPGALHAFDMRQHTVKRVVSGVYVLYDRTATKTAQQLTYDFFSKHLGN